MGNEQEKMETLQLGVLIHLIEELQANAKKKLSGFIPMWSCKTENTKRKYEEGLPTETGENKKKKRRHSFNGGPSEASQQPDWKRSEGSVEELLRKKSVGEVTQILSDRLNQRINNDRRADLQSCKIFKKKLTATDNKKRLSVPVASRPNLPSMNRKIKEFLQEGPNWVIGMSEDEREMQMSVGKISNADMDLLELEMKLFADNNRTVTFSDFEGLEEALLEAPLGEIPKYLQDIASKIEKASGIYKIETVLQNVLILLCAAVHEMENYEGLKQLNWDRLLTWGATYNKAKDVGFQVGFVEKHLKKLLYAYLGFDFKKGNDPKDWIQELEAELNVIEDCLSAKKLFEGNCLSHGLFPQ
ncbi:hypothetical protein COLO4_29745 [Corchorus olitorius]|uniref:Uncharacterized protein n=1 Tax=Corchorus olitorius TaxID=93759 RepID=A0A1R3HDA6_9ROSI|nr:hypothetical protein COLO4_29745 [Corchorus olitorius]